LFRFGVGLDHTARPVAAGKFLLDRGLDGTILNSSNIGGWLGWVLPQPVYLDMRLEVIGEDLYREEAESWTAGGLAQLIAKHSPRLIVHDHHGGSHAWTPQLRTLPEWRPIFVDQTAVVYVREGYADSLPAVDLDGLPGALGIRAVSDAAAEGILRQRVAGPVRRWLQGFVRRTGRESPWRSLGRLCASAGAYGAAEQFFLAGLAADPTGNRAVFGDLGSLYATSGRLQLALLAYDRYLEGEPGSSWAGNARGIVRAQAGDLAGAISDFTRVIEREPKAATAYRNRGLARKTSHDLKGAREDFERVLALDPGDAQTGDALAEIDAARAGESPPGESQPPAR
jgi:tetratricopeptide (TPR) repeat protein